MSADTEKPDTQPANQAPPTGTFQCAAWNCPLPAGTYTGGQWLCSCHRVAAPSEWQNVTTRLTHRRKLIRAYQRARVMGCYDWYQQQELVAQTMRKLERPDLVPKVVTKTRKIYDRHTGRWRDESRDRDERNSGPLWAQRVESTVFNEAVYGLERSAEQPQLVPTAPVWTPPTIGQLVPQNHDEEVFA